MRAQLVMDAKSGAGYGQILVEDAEVFNWPQAILTRESDKKTLGNGGWSEGSHSLPISAWTPAEQGFALSLAPELVDNISSNEHYILEISGIGSCPLRIVGLIQTNIVTAPDFPLPENQEISRTQSPWPENPHLDIREGVEVSPVLSGSEDTGPAPAGVVAAPQIPEQTKKRKGPGCLVLSCVLACIWGAGAWYLYQASMQNANTPPLSDQAEVEEQQGKSHFFEIIPRSTERTSVEDDGTDMDENPGQ